MSTATDLRDSEMEVTLADTTTDADITGTHISALAVPTIKLDQISNWTGVNELPFDPIAERTLEIAAHDEQGELQQGSLSVIFGRPVLVEGKGWACIYQLSAMGRVHASPARGLDAIDSIQQAFTMVHRQLQGMGRLHKITLNGQDDLGFAPAGADLAPKGQGCPVMNGTMGM